MIYHYRGRYGIEKKAKAKAQKRQTLAILFLLVVIFILSTLNPTAPEKIDLSVGTYSTPEHATE